MAMKIELSTEQEQAVKQGRPVEIVDPATNRAYVLTEKTEAAPAGHTSAAAATQADTVPCPPTGACTLRRQRLADLPTPPEVAQEAARSCKRLGLWGKKPRQETEEQLKLQFYFGGQWIAYVPTTGGIVVLDAAPQIGELAFDRHGPGLSDEERCHAVLCALPRWHDTTNDVLTPFTHENPAETQGQNC